MEEKNLKIAFINAYQGKVNRGAETFVSEVSDRLRERCKVEVLGGSMRSRKRWPFVWRFFIDPNGLSILVFTIRKLPQIWSQKYDLIVPLNGGWQAVLVRIVTKLYGAKMVIVGQSGIGWDDRVNLMSFPDQFVAISRKEMAWAKKAIKAVPVTYIPNGVDLNKFKKSGKKLKLNLRGKIVLVVGALTKSKRIGLVIDAVSRLPNVNLLLVGDGEMKKDLITLGKSLLGERFEAMSVPHKSTPAVYRSADLFVLVPKSSESFGIVYVEAMATGLPVVATDDEQRREIVGKAGVLVDGVSSVSVGNAISTALNKNWGDAPRRQAEKFDWDKIAEQYFRLFINLWK